MIAGDSAPGATGILHSAWGFDAWTSRGTRLLGGHVWVTCTDGTYVSATMGWEGLGVDVHGLPNRQTAIVLAQLELALIRRLGGKVGQIISDRGANVVAASRIVSRTLADEGGHVVTCTTCHAHKLNTAASAFFELVPELRPLPGTLPVVPPRDGASAY